MVAANMETGSGKELTEEGKKDHAERLAGVYLSPSISTARTIIAFNPKSDLDAISTRDVMLEEVKKIQAGDLTRIEAMLAAQAHSLQAIFTNCAIKMAGSEYLNQFKVYGALAFKAQNQCRQTLATLAEIKNPKRTTFIKNQATNQQINFAENSENKNLKPANELLSEETNAALDGSGALAAGGAHQELATVEACRR